MATLLQFNGVHDALQERFARHRDLVVGLEFAAARRELEEFQRGLLAHMNDEETLILPLYAARVGHIPGGDPEFFHMEHANLRRRLEELVLLARELEARPGAGRRQAHEFLEAESMFLHLLDHHERRERNVLYPELDRRLTDAERESILKQAGLSKGPEGRHPG